VFGSTRRKIPFLAALFVVHQTPTHYR